MKKIYGFAALSAAMLLASCSNNDEPQVVTPDNEAHTTTGYLAVSLVNPGSDTRAIGDASEYGTTKENEINTVTFFLFGKDASGNQVVKAIESPTMSNTTGSYTDHTGNNNNVGREYNAVIVCNGAFSTLQSYDGILAVANKTKTEFGTDIVAEVKDANGNVTTAGTSLTAVKAIVGAYTATTTGSGTDEKGAFVMSNSVYNDGTSDVVVTPIQGNMAITADEAKEKPVVINVERVLAKVNVPSIDDIDKKKVNNSKYTGDLYVWVDGVEVADQAPESYLVKNINGLSTTAPFTGWNNAQKFRSYWAVTPTSWSTGLDYLNQSFNEIVTGSTANGEKNGVKNFYTQENVPVETGARASSILVACHLSSSQSQDTPVSLVRIPTDNSIVTEANGKGVIIGLLNSSTNFGYVVGNTFYQFDPSTHASYFSFSGSSSLDAHKAALTFKNKAGNDALKLAILSADGTSVKTDDNLEADEETIITQLNAKLAEAAYQVWYWNLGKCYYYTAIAADELTTGTGDSAVKKIGIVRNHIYRLDLEDIAGFGVPVADPSRTIIPDTPTPGNTQDWQLAAKVNVLQWVLVTQGVSFSQGTN